jgi:hypothetical protein
MQSLFYRDKCKDFGEITCKVAGILIPQKNEADRADSEEMGIDSHEA